MTPDTLHCTALFTLERNFEFESDFLSSPHDTIHMKQLFWSDHMSALSVDLSPDQQKLFFRCFLRLMFLCLKEAKQEWKDLGPFVKSCLSATDWSSTADPVVLFSPSLNAFSTCTQLSISVLRTMHCVTAPTSSFYTDVSQLPSELSSVPSFLWTPGLYDVGLIDGMSPVVVTLQQFKMRLCGTVCLTSSCL